MCKLIAETPNLAPGWVCCGCKTYNGDWRPKCKICAKPVCAETSSQARTNTGSILPNPTPIEIVSQVDVEQIARQLNIVGGAIEKILLHVEGMKTLKGMSLVETLQAFMVSGIAEASSDSFQRVSEIVARLPIAQEAQLLGLGMLSGAVPPLKH